MVARPVVIGSHQHWEMVVETGDYIGSEVKTLQGCFEADWGSKAAAVGLEALQLIWGAERGCKRSQKETACWGANPLAGFFRRPR